MPIRPDLPNPEFGQPLEPAQECEATLRLLAQRRSAPVKMLREPGPTREDIDILLTLAARAPDHRKLEPWRFIVFDGPARRDLGALFAEAATMNAGSQEEIDDARALPLRAPVIIAVISAPVNDAKQTPFWEQHLSAGAVCQNLLIASCAMGWAATWISEWPAFDSFVSAGLGIIKGEQIAGFIYLGTAEQPSPERQRSDIKSKVTYWRT